jgi:hypothetical protein
VGSLGALLWARLADGGGATVSLHALTPRVGYVGRAQWVRTPLHWAANEGQASVVTLLLECGANKEVMDWVRRATRSHTRCHSSIARGARCGAATKQRLER